MVYFRKFVKSKLAKKIGMILLKIPSKILRNT